MSTETARDFAQAVELAASGRNCRLVVADDDVAKQVLGKLRSRLGDKRSLVEVVVACAPNPGTCSSCGAAILWARTEAGKAMPINAKPEKRVVLGSRTGRAHVLDTYLPHWASCPSADQHRRTP